MTSLTTAAAGRHEPVLNPVVECGLCRSRIRVGEAAAGRLLEAGAAEAQVMRAAHEPRLMTLADHRQSVG